MQDRFWLTSADLVHVPCSIVVEPGLPLSSRGEFLRVDGEHATEVFCSCALKGWIFWVKHADAGDEDVGCMVIGFLCAIEEGADSVELRDVGAEGDNTRGEEGSTMLSYEGDGRRRRGRWRWLKR